ncbi:unnamed protein product [Didymodactylos carnosus]|uniref:Uncharacterized protein n=1 Tax=Didymodactylos carnosus TaxID=1234261 RepID=A0A815AWE5_9BILA|nr:unnamed protein product [Didymodactylos carnosus]CAF1259838.1 unnamed protein product [Didymodactylos carnosus]CAF3789293.1 unnamed protein product [Didymodactylos carnosus]CAF4036547.1 unnamed protein product [Didymodactylos carnosus]
MTYTSRLKDDDIAEELNREVDERSDSGLKLSSDSDGNDSDGNGDDKSDEEDNQNGGIGVQPTTTTAVPTQDNATLTNQINFTAPNNFICDSGLVHNLSVGASELDYFEDVISKDFFIRTAETINLQVDLCC